MTDELTLMLDHITLSVDDLGRAKAFYQAALAPLGITVVGEVSAEQSGSVAFAGFGIGRKGQLWIAEKGRQTPETHICFRAKDRRDVRAFHAAGLAAGGTDNGPPGVREIYHPAYYAAFVTDPEGHNIEAVCFEPEAVDGEQGVAGGEGQHG
jgi:catechol 2,3-dioxygenase-like lactoylglutathione lyase family enzyme